MQDNRQCLHHAVTSHTSRCLIFCSLECRQRVTAVFNSIMKVTLAVLVSDKAAQQRFKTLSRQNIVLKKFFKVCLVAFVSQLVNHQINKALG